MSIDISPSTIFQGITVAMLGGFGWWFKSIFADFKTAMQKISDHEIAIALLKEKVARLEERQ